MLEKAKGKKRLGKVKEKSLNLTLEDIDKRVAELKNLMKEAAKDLKFEVAIKLREEIKTLNEARLLL